MQTFEDFTTARRAITKFQIQNDADIPDNFRERFEKLCDSPSPVDQIVSVGEFIYANREKMSDAAKDLATGLIGFANVNGFHGLQENGRGAAIIANLRKDMGEIKTAPAEPDPAPGMLIEEPVVTPVEEPAAPTQE
jgi:hypothetical protein